MKIAVVTGASSGMGREFVFQIQQLHPKIQEIWVIARRTQKLEMLPSSPIPLKVLSLDLTSREDQEVYKKELEKNMPQICLLVHCAGMGFLGRMDEISAEDQIRETRVNCEALTAVTLYALPYLKEGSHVIELVSSSGFAPQPGFGVYAATKAYALSFTRTLRAEMRKKKIIVTAVCPGPVDTPFFEIAQRGKKRPIWKTLFLSNPRKVVKKALADSQRGKELSIYGVWIKAWYAVAKLTPHRVILAVLSHDTREEKEHKKG